jgi:threonine/homoserine/homoserine lactone efflux protein
MAEAIGQVLSLGVGVALSPIPIVGVVLMLGTPRARANGSAFIVGWIAGLAVVGTIVLLASSGGDASDDGQPADWVNVLKILLGLGVLLIAVRTWRSRPAEGEEAEMPKWMQTIDAFGAGKAAGFGVLLSGVNPKNLLLAVGAGAAIAQTGIPAGEQAVALAVFVLIATLGVGAPVALYFALGDRSRQMLERMKAWMSQNNAVIMAVLCLVIGVKLLGDGISGF